MTSFSRGVSAAALSLSTLLLMSCSGGVSVPAAGSTTAPSGGNPTSTPASGGNPTSTPVSGGNPTSTPVSGGNPTSTPVSGGNPTSTPVSGGNPTPTAVAVSPTPVSVGPTPTPAPTASGTGTNCASSSNPPNQPVSTTEPFPGGASGGSVQLPKFADQNAQVMLSGNDAKSGTTITIQESQTPFADQAGNGNIPAAPSGYTGISYTASFISPAATLNFTNPGLIHIIASAPCEITAGHTYAAFAYVNGGGFSHLEFGPAGLADTNPFIATNATSGGVTTITFTIDLSKNQPSPNQQPSGGGLEVDLAQKN